MSAPRLAGRFSVEESARIVARFRYAEERAMRILAGWIALTPELPVKILFARHVWDCAQHADLWRRRLPELRAPVGRGEPPDPALGRFMALVEEPAGPAQTAERLLALYGVLKPHLVAVYQAHRAAANPVYEPPTIRILDRCLADERRHLAAGAVLLERVLAGGAGAGRVRDFEARLRAALAAAGGVTGDTPEPPVAAAPDGTDPGPDLVALDSAFDPAVVDPGLQPALDAHRAALLAGDLDAAAGPAVAASRAALLGLYRGLGPVTTAEVVARARVGAYRLIKLRLDGPGPGAVVLLQWRPTGEGWRIFAAERLSNPADQEGRSDA